jgi:hypothetical protein
MALANIVCPAQEKLQTNVVKAELVGSLTPVALGMRVVFIGEGVVFV